MKFTLSDSTIGLIEELGISQQDIAREIKRLYEQGNVSREISQQSISRYLKGGKFTEKDTEGIIMSALRSFVGVRRFAKYRKLYEHRLEQEKQKKEKNNVVSKKSVRNPFIGMSLRELAHNEKLMEYLETEEEQLYREEQQEKAERYQIICFWENAPHEIQRFWFEYIGILPFFSKFVKAMVLSMVGIDQETLLGFADGFYLECCTQNFYSRCVNEFRDDELYTLGKVTQAAGMSNKKLYEFIDVTSDMYQIATMGECEWKIAGTEVETEIGKELKYFLDIYEKSKMFYDEFMVFATYLVCLEKVDWMMIHMAMLLEREENDKEKEIVDGYLWVTENEKTMLYALRERQKVSVHHSEAKND